MAPAPRLLACALAVGLASGAASCRDDGDGRTATTASAAEATEGAPTTTTAPAGIRIERTVTGGALEGEAGRASVPVGEEVTIVVSADEADEVHVHGYDLFADVAPDQPAEITFPADIPGVFEVELEGSGLLVVELEVS